MSFINDILKQVETYGGNLKDNAPMLAILALMGKYMDWQNAKDLGNPYRAGLEAVKGQQTDMTKMFSDARTGYTPDPMVGRMRGALEARANEKFPSPTATPPARFNPYATNATQGQTNPELMAKMMSLIGKQGPTVTSGMQTLGRSMQNRFTPRPIPSNITMPKPTAPALNPITGQPAGFNIPMGGTLTPPVGTIPNKPTYNVPDTSFSEWVRMMMETMRGGG